MNHIIKYLFATLFASCCMVWFVSCSDDDETPGQPDFIVTTLPVSLTIAVGDEFTLSVPDEGDADAWEWKLPNTLMIVKGENTNEILVRAMEEGSIPEGTISVTAKKGGLAGYARTFYKTIQITPPPPKPSYISAANAGSLIAMEGSIVFEKDQEFIFFVPAEENITEYEWTVPEGMTIVRGQGTRQITVVATQRGPVTPNLVSVKTENNKGIIETNTYPKLINILPLEDADGNVYKTKRYGNKVWMVENLRWKGPDGQMGCVYADNPDNESVHGRLYTWHETMTGISKATIEQNPYATIGYEGTDDMNNPFIMGEPSNFGIQIQGICPEGWHVANAYDRYDILIAIADDFGLRRNSLNEIGASLTAGGVYVPSNGERETNPLIAMNLTTHGGVSAYLKAGGPGNPWNNTSSTFSYGGNSIFVGGNWPLYYNERVEIGFNIFPSGRRNAAGVYQDLGVYSYHWYSHNDKESNATSTLRTSVGGANVNWSRGAETMASHLSVRCVANY